MYNYFVQAPGLDKIIIIHGIIILYNAEQDAAGGGASPRAEQAAESRILSNIGKITKNQLSHKHTVQNYVNNYFHDFKYCLKEIRSRSHIQPEKGKSNY